MNMKSVVRVCVIACVLLVPLEALAGDKPGFVTVTTEVHGLDKICGVWDMTVHNMLNHREYHYALHVPPNPDLGPVPTKLLVNGRTVYIRWEFKDGFSEESMLLRREGGVMEGTFMNFAGARGGVSGKLVMPCASDDE